MTRTLPLLLLLPLGGCELFNAGRNTIDGLLNPLVAEGMVISVEGPSIADTGNQPTFDLSESGLEEGTTLTLFLADAANVNEIDQAPVTDASVTLEGVEASGGEGGLYAIAQGLSYAAGTSWTLDVDVADTSASAVVDLPPPASYTLPALAVDTPITIDLTGQGFNSALVVVIRATEGVTYSNKPEGIREFYDFTHGGDEVTTVEIPAEAFPDNGAYAVGVAGLVHTTAEDLTEMNTGLTAIMSGEMVFSTGTIGM